MVDDVPGVSIRRIGAAVPYDAPNHFGTSGMRLQGLEAGGSEKFWVSLSHVLPGGRAGPDASAGEKVYVVLAGELTLRAGGRETRLGRHDSCCILPGTEREMVNLTQDVVTLLVVMPS